MRAAFFDVGDTLVDELTERPATVAGWVS